MQVLMYSGSVGLAVAQRCHRSHSHSLTLFLRDKHASPCIKIVYVAACRRRGLATTVSNRSGLKKFVHLITDMDLIDFGI